MKSLKKYFRIFIENLGFFITILTSIVIIIKSQSDVKPTIDSMLLWIVSLLGLISLSLLIERLFKLESISTILDRIKLQVDRISPSSISVDDVLKQRSNQPKLEDRLKDAKEVWLYGGSLSRLTNEYLGLLEELAKKGTKFRFLLTQPTSEAAKLLAKQVVYEVNEPAAYEASIKNSLKQLGILKTKFPKCIEVRISDCFPLFGLLLVNQKNNSSTLSVELYTNETPTRDRPVLIIEKARIKWFEFYKGQFEKLWVNAKEI